MCDPPVRWCAVRSVFSRSRIRFCNIPAVYIIGSMGYRFVMPLRHRSCFVKDGAAPVIGENAQHASSHRSEERHCAGNARNAVRKLGHKQEAIMQAYMYVRCSLLKTGDPIHIHIGALLARQPQDGAGRAPRSCRFAFPDILCAVCDRRAAVHPVVIPRRILSRCCLGHC